MSKRKLLQLVQQRVVEGWDDARMRPLAGCAGAATRRKSATFARNLGVSKTNGLTEFEKLEYYSGRSESDGSACDDGLRPSSWC